MNSVSKDMFKDLPDELLCHILSFLTTKEAALTSILSKRWRYLLTFVSSLDFDDSIYLHREKRIQNPLNVMGSSCFQIYINNKRMKLSTSFQDFVNRILNLQGNSPLDKFSLKLIDEDDPVDPDCVIPWIHNVLLRGVSDLCLTMHPDEDFSLPSSIFLSKTLVSLRINVGCDTKFDVKEFHLPKLKTLYFEGVLFEGEEHVRFRKLMSGCSVLEELVMDNICSYQWKSFSVSVPTLKRLTFHWNVREENPMSVSFDTPNLVYLEYTEVYATKYPKLNFHSLVEAKIDLLMTEDQIEEVREASASELQVNMVGSATDFIMAIHNVRILYLSENTLEVLTFFCESIPIFNNLTHLTIKSDSDVGWESLPGLLKNCPILKTLIFQGLLHKATERCGEVCLCKSRKEDVSTCLSSSPVRVLKILINNENTEKQIEQVKHFLETMPHLEQVVLYYDSSLDEEVKVSIQQQMLIKVVSPKCKVQLISRDFSVSSAKWGPLL